MKYTKTLVVLLLVLLSACTINRDEITEDESAGIVLSPIVDNEVIEELAVLDPMPHISAYQNQITLLDLVTGEILANYDFNEEERIDEVWDLGDGFYAAWGGGWRNHPQGFVENDFRIVIFDENLTPLETLLYDDEELPMLFLSVLRFVDGELFVYGPDNRNINWDTDSTTNLLRINVHTEEIDILFEVELSLFFYEFIDDQQILVFDQITDWAAGRVHTQYGVLNLETGEIQSFVREGFAQGHIDFHGSKVLIAERHVTVEVENEVIVFDLEDMSSEFIQLEHEESRWARFSLDGHHIVTINEEAYVFRKYDLNGAIIAEVDIERHPSIDDIDDVDFIAIDFEIFPITEQTYALHTHLSFISHDLFTIEHHIQFISLL